MASVTSSAFASNTNDQGGDLDLLTMWRFVWGSRYLISATTLLCALVFLGIAFSIEPIFRAETVISPVHSGSLGGNGSLSGQLGGLASIASMAGVNLDSTSSADRESKAILQSRSLVEEFVKKNNLLNVLLSDSKKPPSMWLAVKNFKEGVLTIRDDKRSGLLTIDMDWTDPAVAAQWANGFVALANERIRARAIDQATRNIDFLNKQIPQTSVVEVQRSIYNLIENELKTLMVASARAEYAFTVIDPAVPPERKLSPKRSLYALFGAFLGFVIGLLTAHVRSVRARPAG
ncbi:MAG: Wzz/FepE/Etk N-terminal domain-containing protein [Steroidobacteraceae bacterium]